MDTDEDVRVGDVDDDDDDDEPFEMQLNDVDYGDHHFGKHHSSPAPRQRRTDKSHQSQLPNNKDWPLTWWPQLIPATHHAVTVNDRERLLPTTDARRRRPTRERSNATNNLQQSLASPSSIDDHNSSPPSPLHHPASKNDGGY